MLQLLMVIFLLVLLNLQDYMGNHIFGEFLGDIKVPFLINQIVVSVIKPFEKERVHLRIQATPTALT